MTTQALVPNGNTDSSSPAFQRFYVGIDIGYKEHVAAVIPLAHFKPSADAREKDHWKRARTLHFKSEASGFRQLQAYLDKFSLDPACFLILLEPTGGYYGMTLIMYLIRGGYQVMQVENKAVKDYREKISGSETKTDDTDARLMARMGFLHEIVGEEFSIQPVHLTNPDDAALKVMVRDLLNLQKEITRRQNQLQQVVAVTFPELKSFFVDSTAGVVARRLLERFPTPQQLAEAGPETIAEVLREAHGYKHVKRAEELVALAQASVGLKMMGHHQWRQGWLIRQLSPLEKARQELIEQLREYVAPHPYTPIIESLPVRSPIWTATLIAVIGNVDRFPNYGQFKAYMGWSPSQAQSGTSVNKSGLANRGVRLSRNVLGQMSIVLLSPNMRTTPFREFYERLVARSVKAMKPATARGHMAGKLSEVLYALLKTKTRYDEARHRRDLGLPDLQEAVPLDSVEAPDDVVQMLNDEDDLLSDEESQ